MTRWRALGSRLLHYGHRALPVVISGSLITWLIWHITVAKLLEALSTGVWPWLVLATALEVVVTFFWDATCVWWLFSQHDRPLRYWTAVRARGEATLWSAINLEIGGGVFAWKISRIQNETLTDAFGRMFVLALFDFGTLQALALVGSFLQPEPLTEWLRWLSVSVICGLFLLVVIYNHLPAGWREWVMGWKLGHWLRWWHWGHSLTLFVLRLIMFLIVVTYAGVCLAVCGVHVDPWIVIGVVPYVLVAESLPGTGGLGEREVALIYLLQVPDNLKGMVLSFGLIWSVMTILGRLTIGLVSTWWPGRDLASQSQPPRTAAA